MGKTLQSPQHRALIDLLVAKREAAGMTQADMAKMLGEYQSFVARIESGQRRIDVVEFISISTILAFDPTVVINAIAKIR